MGRAIHALAVSELAFFPWIMNTGIKPLANNLKNMQACCVYFSQTELCAFSAPLRQTARLDFVDLECTWIYSITENSVPFFPMSLAKDPGYLHWNSWQGFFIKYSGTRKFQNEVFFGDLLVSKPSLNRHLYNMLPNHQGHFAVKVHHKGKAVNPREYFTTLSGN